jgi:hypothetical protein
MNVREAGRIGGILGAALTFFVGLISVVLGLASSTAEQSGDSLIVRGLMLMGLSVVAGYGASLSDRKPALSSILLVLVAVLGSVVAYRSFWVAAGVLIAASVLIYSNRKS